MSDQPTFDTPLQPAADESNPSSLKSAGSPEAASLANAGRDANGVPPVVGLGDGKTELDGKFVPTLSDEDNERLRAIVAAQNPIQELPDGSIIVLAKIPPEAVPVLKEWAEASGMTFYDYLQQHIETCIIQGTLVGLQ